ncbi:MAG: hypothetical protein AAF771_16830 [Pseudomonadota bacterium]
MPRITSDTIATIRLIALSATGLVCLAYALFALALGRPDPFSPWIPLGIGVFAAATIALTAFAAGDDAAEIATDELYFAESHRAQRIGYWIAVALYPAFGVALGSGWVSYPVAFAAMGTLTGAAFLLSFAILNLRGAA